MTITYNIFSIFDPSSSTLSLNWIIFLFFLPLLIKPKTTLNNKINKTIKTLRIFIKSEILLLIGKRAKKLSDNITYKLFILICIINILAIFPFNFTITAHISISFVLTLSIWTSLFLFRIVKNFYNSIIHLTPTGTPEPLINFIVLIEFIRNIIRPITLAIRLTANIVAGHLLISLLANFSLIRNTNLITRVAPIIILTTLELIVAIVQAYVIATLLTLYYNDTL